MEDVYLQGADGLEQGFLERAPQGHHLPGGLHLCAQLTVGRSELIKRPARKFDHTVIERGLKGCPRLPCNSVFDLVQPKSDGDLAGYLGNGIAGRLGGQGAGTAYPGVDFNDVIVKAGGIQGKLYVAAPFDTQGADNF